MTLHESPRSATATSPATTVNPPPLPPSTRPLSSYYNKKGWDYEMPFHQGEVALQKQADVHDSVMSYAPKVVRPYMPEQHRDFYQHQPFLVAAARDRDGRMWATLLESSSSITTTAPTAHLVTSPDPVTLDIRGVPVQGDALYKQLEIGTDIGLLGIEFATARRNRVNGRLAAVASDRLVFTTDQAFGNCPQYIVPRQWWWTAQAAKSTSREETTFAKDALLESGNTTARVYPDRLSLEQMQQIQQANTILVATGYRGEGEDVRFGNDASHRGGPAGFVNVLDNRTLVIPEFAGNNHFNSLGNLILDPRIGISLPDFERGGLLQLSGRAVVDMDTTRAAAMYPGALRLVTVTIEAVNVVPAGSLPVRWKDPSSNQDGSLLLRVNAIVQETPDVKSFYFGPTLDSSSKDSHLLMLEPFRAGQHLPIELVVQENDSKTTTSMLQRSYSLSGPPSDTSEYRISVKRQFLGKASNYLHDRVAVGDVIRAGPPAGDFVKDDTQDTLVLLSSGIGITPILSMLYEHVQEQLMSQSTIKRKAVWIHGARNRKHHAFAHEVRALEKLAPSGSLETHMFYSRPQEHDDDDDKDVSFTRGRITPRVVQQLVPDLQDSQVYLCGPASFLADLESGLEALGVDGSRIHFESF